MLFISVANSVFLRASLLSQKIVRNYTFFIGL
ncbi:MAG: hypothetical protein ACI9A7_001211 [Cyclobacteriaceae bacterium]